MRAKWPRRSNCASRMGQAQGPRDEGQSTRSVVAISTSFAFAKAAGGGSVRSCTARRWSRPALS